MYMSVTVRMSVRSVLVRSVLLRRLVCISMRVPMFVVFVFMLIMLHRTCIP